MYVSCDGFHPMIRTELLFRKRTHACEQQLSVHASAGRSFWLPGAETTGEAGRLEPGIRRGMTLSMVYPLVFYCSSLFQ